MSFEIHHYSILLLRYPSKHVSVKATSFRPVPSLVSVFSCFDVIESTEDAGSGRIIVIISCPQSRALHDILRFFKHDVHLTSIHLLVAFHLVHFVHFILFLFIVVPDHIVPALQPHVHFSTLRLVVVISYPFEHQPPIQIPHRQLPAILVHGHFCQHPRLVHVLLKLAQ